MNDDQKITWKKNSGTQKKTTDKNTSQSESSLLGDETVLDLATRSADRKATNQNIKSSEKINTLQEDIKKMIAEIEDDNVSKKSEIVKNSSDTVQNIKEKPLSNHVIDESNIGSPVTAAAMAAINKKQELSKSVSEEVSLKKEDSSETESQKKENIDSIKKSIAGKLDTSKNLNKDNVLDEQTKKLLSEKEQKKGVEHTYYSDLSSAMGSNEPGTMSELLKKARFEKKSKEIFSPRSKKNMTYIIGALLLLVGIIWIISGLISHGKKTVKYIKEKRVDSLVYSDMDTGINVTNIDSSVIKQAIRKVIKTKIPEDTLGQIYYVGKDTLGNTRRLGFKQIFDATENKPPALLYENVENNFMHGVYKTDKNHPFIILKALSYDRAFEGMKEWEPTMIDDLSPYLDLPKEAGDRSLLESGFSDSLIKNKNVRVARFLPRASDKKGIFDILKSSLKNSDTTTEAETNNKQDNNIVNPESNLENTVAFIEKSISDVILNSANISYAQTQTQDNLNNFKKGVDITQEINIGTNDLEIAKARCKASEARIYEKEKERASKFVEYYQQMDSCNQIDVEDPNYESVFGLCQATADSLLTGTGYTAADAISTNQVEVDHTAALVHCDNLTLDDLNIKESQDISTTNDLKKAIEQCLQKENSIFTEEKRRAEIFANYYQQMDTCDGINVEDPNYESLLNICEMTAESPLIDNGYTLKDEITLEQVNADHTAEVNRCQTLTLEDLGIQDAQSIYDDGIYIYDKPRDVLWDILHQLYLDGLSSLYNDNVHIGEAAPIVKPVQEVLSLIGIMDDISITGEIDLVTQDAISNFQEVNGIPQSGVIDPMTINIINGIITNQGNVFGNSDSASINNYISDGTPIGLGTYNNSVQEIQMLLYVNGYDISNINGLFDGELCQAIYQYEEYNNLPHSSNASCIIPGPTIESLNKLIKEGNYLGAGFAVTKEKGINSCKQFDKYIGIGSKGSQITLLQEILQRQGYYNGDNDGIFDQEVLDALHSYQKANNLPLSGGLNSQTVFSLNQNILQDGQTSTAFTGLMELDMSSSQISKIQKLLKNQSYFNEKVNGILDQKTCESVKQYQTNNNLSVSDATCTLNSETVDALNNLYCKVYPSDQIKTMHGFGIFDGLFGPGTANFGTNTANADSLKEGDIVLIYTFLDEKTILITRDESVITEIIKRRALNDIFNKS